MGELVGCCGWWVVSMTACGYKFSASEWLHPAAAGQMIDSQDWCIPAWQKAGICLFLFLLTYTKTFLVPSPPLLDHSYFHYHCFCFKITIPSKSCRFALILCRVCHGSSSLPSLCCYFTIIFLLISLQVFHLDMLYPGSN